MRAPQIKILFPRDIDENSLAKIAGSFLKFYKSYSKERVTAMTTTSIQTRRLNSNVKSDLRHIDFDMRTVMNWFPVVGTVSNAVAIFSSVA